ncbi:MAG: hypoxanthine phosphoribosyltransferase [Spirochaetales bacterium]|nr:hypoxanthine phosphoribosyltransferase [Spirochaetales bacterium]
MPLPEGIESLLFTAREIQARVLELGQQISRDYAGKTPLLVGLLKGSFIFLSDLARALSVDAQVEFMVVSSYGNSQENSEVRILFDLPVPIQGRDLLIVEDMIDTGLTLAKVVEILSARNPRSVKVCTLLNKPSRRRVPVAIDYNGFDIPDVFVAGYGIDYAQKYRNLPYLAVTMKA